jgi:hypothetical protein
MIVKIVVPDSIYAQVYFARGEQGPQGATGSQGVQGPTGATGATGASGSNGVGYTGVTSTSSIPVSVGLHTWTVGTVGAFLPGMRIRAIHTDTPSIWLEGFANVASGTTIIITADKVSGAGTHNTWKFAVAGEIGPAGATGATGPSGVIAVTAPITNSGTSTSANIGLDLTDIAPKASPTFTGTVTLPFTSSGLLVSGSTGAVTKTDAAPGLGYFPSTGTGGAGYVWNLLSNYARRDQANTFTVGGHSITNDAVGTVPLYIRGVSGQTGDLLQLQNSSGTKGTWVTSGFGLYSQGLFTGRFIQDYNGTAPYIDIDNSANRLRVNARSASNVGLIVIGAASQSANLQEWQNSAGTVLSRIDSAGGASLAGNLNMTATNSYVNVSGTNVLTLNSQPQVNFFNTATGASTNGGGQKVIHIGNATVVPSSNPTGGGILYVDAGALKYRGTSGTVTTIANA